MPLYYVTGVSGSGKSTVLAELKRRGFEAYGTDEDDLAGFYHLETGKKTSPNLTAKERTEKWRKYHEWKVPTEKVEALRLNAHSKPIFLCGVVANDADFWSKFAQVFCLYLPSEETKHRIENRTNNDFGKNAHELASILEWASYSKTQYKKLGAVLIDATLPVKKVTDEIIDHVL